MIQKKIIEITGNWKKQYLVVYSDQSSQWAFKLVTVTINIVTMHVKKKAIDSLFTSDWDFFIPSL